MGEGEMRKFTDMAAKGEGESRETGEQLPQPTERQPDDSKKNYP